eukprot:667615-Prorocentrum_minimum.AAC.4
MSMSLPNRDELLLRRVFAFPNASRIGFVCSTCSSIPLPPARVARYCMAIFVVSVFPAPDSPLITIDWSTPSPFIAQNALLAMRNTCGSSVVCFWYCRRTSCEYTFSFLNGLTAIKRGPARV